MAETGRLVANSVGLFVRLLLVALVGLILAWQLELSLLPLFVPYLLYEIVAVVWPRLEKDQRHLTLLTAVIVIGVIGYAFGYSVIVGLGILLVLAPVLDFMLFNRGFLVLASDVMGLTQAESRFGNPEHDRRTKKYSLNVNHLSGDSESGYCPDCGTDLDTLLVGSHCPKCGNPDVVDD